MGTMVFPLDAYIQSTQWEDRIKKELLPEEHEENAMITLEVVPSNKWSQGVALGFFSQESAWS